MVDIELKGRQVLRGVQRLLVLSIGFRIDSVRVNSSGDVKIG